MTLKAEESHSLSLICSESDWTKVSPYSFINLMSLQCTHIHIINNNIIIIIYSSFVYNLFIYVLVYLFISSVSIFINTTTLNNNNCYLNYFNNFNNNSDKKTYTTNCYDPRWNLRVLRWKHLNWMNLRGCVCMWWWTQKLQPNKDLRIY